MLRLPDLDNFEHEWDIDHDLPWQAATSVFAGAEHPDVLDAKLIDAITSTALPSSISANKRAVPSCIAFLYLYMSLSVNERRYIEAVPEE